MQSIDKFSLKKKIIFVVGGSGQIGSEVCKLFSELKGKVINLDITKNKKQKKNVSFFKIDVANSSNIEKNLKDAIKKYGCPNVFINCSYPYDSNWGQTSFKDVNMNTINSNIKLHLNSYIWLARLIAEQMLIKKIRGSIIQFGSTYGVVGQITDIYDGTHIKENMIYSAIKGGIINNSRQMSSHYGKFGIRVNTICPGGVLGYVAGQSNKIPEKFLKRYISRTPLKRFAKAKEIAYATAFLSSDASSYITGTTFMVDGGWTAI